ncbi:MAG TPA: hypothetical protein VL309_11800 [Vicinamibacterales bacterium]|nr:hypothetical protein [Vicinamibacterales bacterium]
MLVETTHDILRHLSQCSSCRAEVDSRRRLRAGLRGAFERAPELQAGPEFLSSIGQRVLERNRRSRSRSTWRSVLAIAASLLLASGAVFGGRQWLGASRFAALARAAAGDHQNCAVRFSLKERPISLEEAARRFDRAYASLVAVAPSPASLGHGELAVLERHACVFDGRRFAHIVLRYRGRVISLLVTPDRLARIPAEPVSLDAAPLVSFRVGRFAVFLVGPANDGEAREIAAAFTGPLTQALAGA